MIAAPFWHRCDFYRWRGRSAVAGQIYLVPGDCGVALRLLGFYGPIGTILAVYMNSMLEPRIS